MPPAIDRNAGEGTSITADSETRTVMPGQQDGLAGGVHGLGDGLAWGLVVAHAGRPEPDDEEECVVDAEGEGEHHGEVHRPDRDGHELVDEDQRAGGGDEAGEGQDEREPGGDQGAEGEDEDGEGDGPRQHLGLEHGVEVGLVEVRPQQGGAGRVDLDAVTGQGLELGP